MPSGQYRRNTGIVGQPPVTKKCACCGIDFFCKASHAARRTHCSKNCMYQGKTNASLVTKLCKHCGKAFSSQPYRNVVMCSAECVKASRSVRRAKDSVGWYIQAKSGYVVRSFQGRTQLQHRYIMEQHLGRPLEPFENIHHVNGVKDDNRIENLEIWITKQPQGQRTEDLISWAIAILNKHGYSVTKT